MPGHVFSRAGAEPLVVDHADGAVVVDTSGRRYLDGAGGAVVVGVGHGVQRVVDAIAAQARSVAYVHASTFTSPVLEEYADALAAVLPLEDARVFPVSGGSEAVETALKMARAYHRARGEDRHVVLGRVGSYHGSTRGALDVSGRDGLRAPYLPWLGAAGHVSTPTEYRCPFPDTHPHGCGARHAALLEEAITTLPPESVAAFVAEPVAGAALAACVPPPDYWPAIRAVCDRHGVLLVADEVMTGFGRTGRWFACEHWDVQPDLLVAGKGAASGYWPLGLTVASGRVHDVVVGAGFVHGLTYSHHAVGAAAGLAVLTELRERDLVGAAARAGALLHDRLVALLGGHPHVGDVRGLGLLRAVELVEDRSARSPFPRADTVAERVLAAARRRGLLLYPSTGGADGVRGDALVLGPPLGVTDTEVEEIAGRTAAAVRDVLGPG